MQHPSSINKKQMDNMSAPGRKTSFPRDLSGLLARFCRLRFVTLCIIALLALAIPIEKARCQQPQDYPTTPTTRPDGKKWRIGYLEGGQYNDYKAMLYFLVSELEELGWLRLPEHPDFKNMGHKELWDFLVANTQSEYLEFVPDAYYSPRNFDINLRPKVRAEVLKRLNEKGDIDLMLALGTWAGQDLATDEHSVPVEVISSSDPVGSGIVPSAYDSGLKHLHTKVDPWRYSRQLEIFHDFVEFNRLGVVYEPSPEGRTFAAMNDVYAAASHFGFEVLECHAPFNGVSQEESEATVVECYKKLAPQVDAVYISVHKGVNPKTLSIFVPELNRHRVKSFSMLGTNEVKYGVMLSQAQSSFAHVCRFHAESIAKTLNGATPGTLPMLFQPPVKLAFNRATALETGYVPPVTLLAAADKIYTTICSADVRTDLE